MPVEIDAALKPFEGEAAEALGRLRSAFTAVLTALAAQGKPVRGAADLRRALNIDNKLCWQVVRVANALAPMEAGPHVPTPAGFRQLCAAATKCAVSTQVVEEVRRASELFEAMVTVHAGDRGTFDAMVAPFADPGDVISIAHRRAAFRASSHILGADAEAYILCNVVQTGEDPSTVDRAFINGFVGLRRLRTDVPLIVARLGSTNYRGEVYDRSVRSPLDPEASPAIGFGLMRRYCSEAVPTPHEFKSEPEGFVYTELPSTPIGNRGSMNCMLGCIERRTMPRFGVDGKGGKSGWSPRLRIPCRSLLLDFIVRDGTFGEPFEPQLHVHGDYIGSWRPGSVMRDRDCLPMRGELTLMGRGSDGLSTPLFPRYTEMVNEAFAALSSPASEFRAYRYAFEYPVTPSTVVIEFDAPRTPPE